MNINKSFFRFSTLNFIFIILYVNVFQKIFGTENSIVGVIFTIMMSASMVRDLTAEPVRHLLVQALILVGMAVAACLVAVLPLHLSFAVNFITLMMILYGFTYEYSSHMYFPYILSYLFLVFISPVDVAHLPKRILGMLFGALSIILYQWFMGRNRVVETASDVLSKMIDDICGFISYKCKETDTTPNLDDMHHRLSHLSQTVYDRQKKVLCVSDASFSMLEVGRSLEKLLGLIQEISANPSDKERTLLVKVSDQLKVYRAFLQQKIQILPALNPQDFFDGAPQEESLFYKTLLFTHDRLEHMTNPEAQSRYRETKLPLKIRIKIALDLSPVRVIYSLRTALLLSLGSLLVLGMGLPHGKWLIFTIASVSLPYADDVPDKMKNRLIATLVGGLVSVAAYSLIPSMAGRTAIMMLSGYVSFYFTSYRHTFACSTIGALGGAVFTSAFTLEAVGSLFLIRVGYVLAGALAAYAVNCLILPYNREKATVHLWKKYRAVADYLAQKGHGKKMDDQLYYNLVIRSYMMEEKLSQNKQSFET